MFTQKSGLCWSGGVVFRCTDHRFKLNPVTKHTSTSIYAPTLRPRPSHSVSLTVFFCLFTCTSGPAEGALTQAGSIQAPSVSDLMLLLTCP